MKELSFQDSYEVYLLRTNYEVECPIFYRKDPGEVHAASGRDSETYEKTDGRGI